MSVSCIFLNCPYKIFGQPLGGGRLMLYSSR